MMIPVDLLLLGAATATQAQLWLQPGSRSPITAAILERPLGHPPAAWPSGLPPDGHFLHLPLLTSLVNAEGIQAICGALSTAVGHGGDVEPSWWRQSTSASRSWRAKQGGLLSLCGFPEGNWLALPDLIHRTPPWFLFTDECGMWWNSSKALSRT